MPELHRRADSARLGALLNLALAVIALVVIVAAGASIDAAALVMFIVGGAIGAALSLRCAVGEGAESAGPPAPARRPRRR